MQAALAGSSTNIVAVGAAILSERRKLIIVWGRGALVQCCFQGGSPSNFFFLLAPSPVLALELKMAG